MKRLTCALLLLTGALLIPSAMRAQSTGAIAGNVEDTTAGALPGVAVEVSSSALIEGVRTGITDASGNYRVIELPPGTYSVTFTLPGFSTVIREGVELTSGFTANVSAEMPVGGVEETVTVTGASPVVDIQNTQGRTLVSTATIEALPVGRTRRAVAELTLGAVSASRDALIIDQGGSKGDGTQRLSVHGMRGFDQRIFYDGKFQNNTSSDGSGQSWMTNQMAVQELVMGTSTASAELESSGMTVNYVPREGANQFSFSFVGAGAVEDMQADNLSAEILAAGVTTGQKVKSIWDWGGGAGGPIVDDRVWFYTTLRWWGSKEFQPGAFYNKSDSPFRYEADLDRRAFVDTHATDGGVRITWQAAEQHKFNVDFHLQNSCQCFLILRSFSPPASSPGVQFWPSWQLIPKWTYVHSNNLLFEAGVGYGNFRFDLEREDRFPDTPRVRELSPFVITNGSFFGCCSAGDGSNIHYDNLDQHFSLSYVTGSHNFKVGQAWVEAWHPRNQQIQQNLSYDLFGGSPFRVEQFALPINWEDRWRSIGLYAQDQWTIDRLTLNLGVRYDHFEGWVPAGSKPPTDFLAGFSYDRVNDVPNFNDISPRIGAAYDLFGDGKTAIKGAFGRYSGSLGAGIATDNNPELALVLSTNRNWNDADGDFMPDCDLTNFAANDECGAIRNSAFGQTSRNTFYSPSLIEGWGERAYSWQGNIQVQQEVYPGVGLNVAYYFTSYRNFEVDQNRLVTAAAFDPYCVTAPSDARLPGGGGNQICGLFDINAANFGLSETLVTRAEEFSDQRQLERYDGVDVELHARLPQGGLLTGGVSVGRKRSDTCYANARPDITVDDPNRRGAFPRTSGFCDVTPPWSAGTQFKASGYYPLPWGGLEPSFTFVSYPGRDVLASASIANADIAPSLGRNLSACPAPTGACTARASVALIPGATQFLDRVNTLNLAVAKMLPIGQYRLKGTVELYNVFNDSSVLNYNANFGSSWLQPTSIIGGRLLKFQATFDF